MRLRDLIPSRRFPHLSTAIAIAVGFMVVGSALMFSSQAATPFMSAEPEAGAITNPARSVTDTQASGGKSVIFSAATGGSQTINVATSAELTAAVAGALPGDTIVLADGTYFAKLKVGNYTGSFVPQVSGTADKPITLKGSRGAIITGDGQGGHYGLYCVNADYWRIEGITVSEATKGIVMDGCNHLVFDNIHITNIGQEGIHFRSHSSDNILQNSLVNHTGVRSEAYGEGIYIGSANSNWGTYTGGEPDKSDRNQILNTTIEFTGAESIDIKEGTTGGTIIGNRFDGTGMGGGFADSWIDVKGNGYIINDNIGNDALKDGFQIHVAIEGWGNNNYFSGNTLNVNGPGYGLSVQARTTGNIWKCNNVVTGAASGDTVENGYLPYPCTP